MSEHIIELTDANFEAEVLKSETPVLVDFWAPWCGPCVALTPTLEKVAEEVSATVKVGKLNVDDNGKVSDMFGIRSIPTLILFKNGVEVSRYKGDRSKTDLVSYATNG